MEASDGYSLPYSAGPYGGTRWASRTPFETVTESSFTSLSISGTTSIITSSPGLKGDNSETTVVVVTTTDSDKKSGPRATIIKTLTSAIDTSNTGATSSTPVAPDSTRTRNATDNEGPSSSVKAGIGVGIPLGLAALGAFTYLLWRFRRNALHKSRQTDHEDLIRNPTTLEKSEMDGTGKAELEASEAHELAAPSRLQMSELEAAHGSSEVF
ncbi:MAG: hypothetical protein M1820_000177 [Bogoriella megaspora]|nr:MAG: hypothetical protein M1820_000177 [Bogoriella megaspora]